MYRITHIRRTSFTTYVARKRIAVASVAIVFTVQNPHWKRKYPIDRTVPAAGHDGMEALRGARLRRQVMFLAMFGLAFLIFLLFLRYIATR